MRKAIPFILLALSLSGCKVKDQAVPPADGIYYGTLATPTSTDTVYALIDVNGNGMIVDQTTPAIYGFTAPPADSDGHFTTGFTYCAGATFGVSSSTCSTSANTLIGTLNGTSSDLGGSSTQNTITGTISTAGAPGEAFTLNFNSTAYKGDVESLSTLVAPSGSNNNEPALSFSYTPTGSTSGTAATTVTFTLVNTLETNTTTGLTYYTFMGNDSQGCSYSGNISMPNGDYNAYELSITPTCSGTQLTPRSGLAYVNGTSPPTITLEYNDGSNFGVATANATITN